MRALGLSVVRGSSSRGAARGLSALLRLLRGGVDLAFAVDGPRGPLHQPKRGAAFAAKKSGAALVPFGSAASRCFVVERAWDRFEVPCPFARVVVAAGTPVDPEAALADPTKLARAIDEARQAALRALDGRPELARVAAR